MKMTFLMSVEKELAMGNFSSKSTEKSASTKTIKDLPDDALFLIFKNLNCTELINTVPSVCRRWRDLALHYSVWAQRQVKATDIGGTETLNKILTYIPVVHIVDFARTRVEDSTIQAILNSSIRIRNLKLYDCTIEPNAIPSINTVLVHLSKSLEGLDIELQNGLVQYRSLFNLSKMVNLRRLTLIGDEYLDGHLKEFKLDCPLLESLDLSRFNSRTYLHSDPKRYLFTSNLINETQRNLKELYLPSYCDKTILDSVKQCSCLTTISLQLQYVAVVSHLPLIETLIVHCDSSENPPVTWTRPKGLKVLVLHLRQPKEVSVTFLKSIKAQSLTLISDNLCKELEQFCSDNVKRLILRCFFLRLRHLSVTISREAAMPNLEYLDVRKCFLGKGVPPKILSNLKGRFPRLTVRSDRFVGYQNKREPRNDVDCILQESTDLSDIE